ncbi:MAG TPA: magnesium and cobalt transport protein CorA [Desulfotomaculum sp.]|nr:MAG: Magnesium and cobalt transporter protein [Desulfotomaculum sp. 46_80]HAG10047.1 magnesium and cobalt transport protein CorA [Desulfotomaculum sp.]HBY04505.1 magnesium and cobalt transport protein CorA [Desulfotomaculum sp.]
MVRTIGSRALKAGLPPGTLVHIGQKRSDQVKITFTEYSESQYLSREIKEIKEFLPLKNKPVVSWIDISGIHSLETIENIGKYFKLHPLILEDIANSEQRSKVEDFGAYLFIVLKFLSYDAEKKLGIEQISFILGSNFVITFQEHGEDAFLPIKTRIKNSAGKIRTMGADYLAYSLIDAIVDNYFVILEEIGLKLDILEEELVTNPTRDTLRLIHQLKREMLLIRKSIWPSREVISSLQRGEFSFFEDIAVLHLKDVYDHAIQVIDTIETLRDMLSEMMDIYLSSISNRINDVMRVLTIITTIFIPLSFIAGVYGMNFKYMPELNWRCSYPIVLFSMLLLGILMLVYFRKKKWL